MTKKCDFYYYYEEDKVIFNKKNKCLNLDDITAHIFSQFMFRSI